MGKVSASEIGNVVAELYIVYPRGGFQTRKGGRGCCAWDGAARIERE